MQAIIDFLDGRKTYIVALAAAVFHAGLVLGWWEATSEIWLAIDGLFVSLLGMTFRAALKK